MNYPGWQLRAPLVIHHLTVAARLLMRCNRKGQQGIITLYECTTSARARALLLHGDIWRCSGSSCCSRGCCCCSSSRSCRRRHGLLPLHHLLLLLHGELLLLLLHVRG